jgi:hypothetical protein
LITPLTTLMSLPRTLPLTAAIMVFDRMVQPANPSPKNPRNSSRRGSPTWRYARRPVTEDCHQGASLTG